MKPTSIHLLITLLGALSVQAAEPANPAGTRPSPGQHVVRIGAAQPRSRLIDYGLTNSAEVLNQVENALGDLERLVRKAGAEHCDAIAFPEDTMGLGKWEAAHEGKEVLQKAEKRMLERLGHSAASHNMYLICCND